MLQALNFLFLRVRLLRPPRLGGIRKSLDIRLGIETYDEECYLYESKRDKQLCNGVDYRAYRGDYTAADNEYSDICEQQQSDIL